MRNQRPHLAKKKRITTGNKSSYKDMMLHLKFETIPENE